MLEDYGMQRFSTVDHIFVRIKSDCKVFLLVYKEIDYFLLEGTDIKIQQFFGLVDRAFTLCATGFSFNLIFLRCTIDLDASGSVCMDIYSYMERLNPQYTSRDRQFRPHTPSDDHDKS